MFKWSIFLFFSSFSYLFLNSTNSSLHSCKGDNTNSRAIINYSWWKKHVSLILKNISACFDCINLLLNRNWFTCQWCFLNLKRYWFKSENSNISWNAITSIKSDNITWNKCFCIKFLPFWVSLHLAWSCLHIFKSFECRFSISVLINSDYCIQNQNK